MVVAEFAGQSLGLRLLNAHGFALKPPSGRSCRMLRGSQSVGPPKSERSAINSQNTLQLEWPTAAWHFRCGSGANIVALSCRVWSLSGRTVCQADRSDWKAPDLTMMSSERHRHIFHFSVGGASVGAEGGGALGECVLGSGPSIILCSATLLVSLQYSTVLLEPGVRSRFMMCSV